MIKIGDNQITGWFKVRADKNFELEDSTLNDVNMSTSGSLAVSYSQLNNFKLDKSGCDEHSTISIDGTTMDDVTLELKSDEITFLSSTLNSTIIKSEGHHFNCENVSIDSIDLFVTCDCSLTGIQMQMSYDGDKAVIEIKDKETIRKLNAFRKSANSRLLSLKSQKYDDTALIQEMELQSGLFIKGAALVVYINILKAVFQEKMIDCVKRSGLSLNVLSACYNNDKMFTAFTEFLEKTGVFIVKCQNSDYGVLADYREYKTSVRPYKESDERGKVFNDLVSPFLSNYFRVFEEIEASTTIEDITKMKDDPTGKAATYFLTKVFDEYKKVMIAKAKAGTLVV